MSKLHQDPEVLSIAQALNLSTAGNAVEHILYFCRERISAWLKEYPHISNIADVELLICHKLRLVIEEFSSDKELEEICERYAAMGELVFKSLPGSFDDDTYATLLERRKVNKRSPDRYVALVDCRGSKALRRFFTRWHEIAHILTNGKQLLLPLHRSGKQQNGEEKLMDLIAAEIGFYSDVFDPILHQEIELAAGRLTFKCIDRVRERFSNEASFQATLSACLKRSGLPVSFVECGLGFKSAERVQMESGQGVLLSGTAPVAKLRVKKCIPANGGIFFHRNMAVPDSSLIMRSFLGANVESSEYLAEESISVWVHSDGRSLGDQKVLIEVRKTGEQVLALVRSLSALSSS